jgi:hypothetical protein
MFRLPSTAQSSSNTFFAQGSAQSPVPKLPLQRPVQSFAPKFRTNSLASKFHAQSFAPNFSLKQVRFKVRPKNVALKVVGIASPTSNGVDLM